jgi:hypothetical protein
MNEIRKYSQKCAAIHLSGAGVNRYAQASSGRVTKSKELSVDIDIEEECIRVCRHFPECPYTPPAGDADCPGCRASEQYLDD